MLTKTSLFPAFFFGYLERKPVIIFSWKEHTVIIKLRHCGNVWNFSYIQISKRIPFLFFKSHFFSSHNPNDMKITLLLYKKLKLIHRSIVKHKIFVKTLKRMFLYMIQILASVILGSKKPRNSKTSKATQALQIFTWLYYTILLKYKRNLPEVFTRKRLLRKFIQIALWHEFLL